METNPTKQLARQRGLVYLEYARSYLNREDLLNARSAAEEGLILTCGPFYLAVRDQLEDLLEVIKTRTVRQVRLDFGHSKQLN